MERKNCTLTYKVIETGVVTDEEIEKIVNTYVRKGWRFEGIHFAMKETSRRPSMAFIFFTKEDGEKIE